MLLNVLDQNPKLSAESLADNHLVPAITACAKLFSTAAIELCGDVKLEPSATGLKEYRIGNTVMLPPIKDDRLRPWIDWIKEEYQRGWWLVTYCWLLDKERSVRFGPKVEQHPDAVKLNLWAQGHLTALFTRRYKLVNSFPVVTPEVVITDSVDPIAEYRKLYAARGGRMKWSGPRQKPEWMGGPAKTVVNIVCEKCGSDAGGALCAQTDCPIQGVPF